MALLFSQGGGEVACRRARGVQELCRVCNSFIITHGFVHWFVWNGLPWEAFRKFPVDVFLLIHCVEQGLYAHTDIPYPCCITLLFGTPSTGDLWLKISWSPICVVYWWNIRHQHEALGPHQSSKAAFLIDLHCDHLEGRIVRLLSEEEFIYASNMWRFKACVDIIDFHATTNKQKKVPPVRFLLFIEDVLQCSIKNFHCQSVWHCPRRWLYTHGRGMPKLSDVWMTHWGLCSSGWVGSQI